MPAIPTPPPDASGGFMVIQYSNGTDTHRMRVHVLPFATNRYIIGGGTPSVAVDDGNHDYAYNPDRPAGMEAGIADTFQAFVNKVKPAFAPNWTFTLLSLYQNLAGVLTEVFPTPLATPINGTSAQAATTGIARCVEEIFNLRTSGGHRARFIWIGCNNAYTPGLPYTVTGNAGGSSEPQFVAYVNSSATGVVAHDGQKVGNVAHVTTLLNRRLRRRYGFA